MATVRIISHGTVQWEQYLEKVKLRAMDAAPFFYDALIPDMELASEQLFYSQGRRGGGSWKFLSKETIDTKARKMQDPRINIATFNLLQSLTYSDEPDAIRKVSGWKVEFGSTAPGAEQSQKFRPIIKFTKYDRRRWAGMLAEYIVGFKRV